MWSVLRVVSRWVHFCEIVRGSGLTFHNQHPPHLTCYVPSHCYFQHTPWPRSRAAGSWLTCSRGREILEDSWEGGDSQQTCKDTKHLWQSHMVNSPLDKDERRWQTFQTFLAMPVDPLSESKPHIIFASLGHFPPNTQVSSGITILCLFTLPTFIFPFVCKEHITIEALIYKDTCGPHVQLLDPSLYFSAALQSLITS